MSAELRALTSKADLWELEDRDEIAESMDEVRGMTRLGVRSPGIECTELTEEEPDRSGSGARVDFGVLVSPARPLAFAESVPTISGDCDGL